MEFHVAVGEEKVGPFTIEEVQSMLAAGSITMDTYVWTSGMKDWQRFHTIAKTIQPAANKPSIQEIPSNREPLGSVITSTRRVSWRRHLRSLSLRAQLTIAGVVLAIACILWYASSRNASLTRKKALTMLQQLEFHPEMEVAHSVWSDTFPPSASEVDKDWERANLVKFYVAAVADGLIEMKQYTDGRYKTWEAHSTAKGKEFSHIKDGTKDTILGFDMGTKKAAQVTSIGAPSQMGGKTVSVVNFDFAYTPTPFGIAFDRGNGYRKYSGHTADTAVFALYDDGWHLEHVGR